MMVSNSLSGRITRIADGNVGRPMLSADGTTVVYTRWNGSDWDIERHRDGQMEAVSKNPNHDLSPQVSANGDVVVWSRTDASTGDSDIYRWENGKETPVATTPANETQPSITADGKSVVYVYDDLEKKYGFDIHRCSDDGECEVLTDDWPVDIEPFQSDDGKRVFFRRKVDFDGGDIWMRDDRGTVKQLTFDKFDEFRPRVSGDGKTLAFSKDTGTGNDVFLYNLADGSREQIGEADSNEQDPALSVDGKVLAYSRSAKGESQILLRENGETVPITQGGSNGWPALSADGQVIAWVGVDPDNPTQRAIFKLER